MSRTLKLLVFTICVFILGAGFSFSATPTSTATPITHRDWKHSRAIADLPAPVMLYALGDVHGDCDRMLELLAAAKLISRPSPDAGKVQWSGGDADLVILGDMIDKYNQSLRVLQTLRALEPQAKEAGGRLVICLGNHEAEFLASGGLDEKNAELAKEMTDAGISAADVAAGRDRDGLGAWLLNLPVGARIGDWFFCHAGNTGGKALAELERRLEKELASVGYSTPLLANLNSMLEARMHPRPWWTAIADPALHELQTIPGPALPVRDGTVPSKLLATVTLLGARHLVIGHQPGTITFDDGATRMAGEMHAHYNGLFFMIDTGMSRGVAGGRGALLQIHTAASHVQATAIYADAATKLLWKN